MSSYLAVLAIAVSLLFGMSSAVSADDTGYHLNPNASCDGGHGAFGAFSHHFATYDPANPGFNWISADAKEDGGLGAATGPAQKAAAALCNGN